PVSDYNIYRPAASDSEEFSGFSFRSREFASAGRTFAQAATGQTGFTGTNDLIGFSYDPRFIATDDTNYANNNFNLAAGSPASDSGQFLMRASGAGAAATTINVLGNGLSNDPRVYFMSAASFLEAAPDRIQIEGCGEVTITAMTSTSISFTPAC